MNDPVETLVVASVAAAVASLIGALVGFAGNLFFVAVVAIVLGPRDATILALMVLSVTPMFVTFVDREHVDRRRVGWMVGATIPVAGLGILVQRWAPEIVLRLIVGIVAVAAGANALRPPATDQDPAPPPWRRVARAFLLPLGGFVHGAVGTGGPAVVAWLAGEITDKSRFRSTLCAFWVILNPLIIAAALVGAPHIGIHLERLAVCAPAAVLGTLAGDRLHRRLPQELFRRVVAVLLLVLGAFVLARTGW